MKLIRCGVINKLFIFYNFSIDTADSWNMFNGDIIPALGVMAFGKKTLEDDWITCLALNLKLILAFMCHHNTFLVYQNLQNASLPKWKRITHWSVGFALLISSAFGVAGYMTFRGSSQGKNIQFNPIIFVFII